MDLSSGQRECRKGLLIITLGARYKQQGGRDSYGVPKYQIQREKTTMCLTP